MCHVRRASPRVAVHCFATVCQERPLRPPCLPLSPLQFSPSKCLPGGRAGAEELAAALDLGCALRVQGLDTASLKDPSAPVALLVEAAPLKASQVRAAGAAHACVEAGMGV